MKKTIAYLLLTMLMSTLAACSSDPFESAGFMPTAQQAAGVKEEAGAVVNAPQTKETAPIPISVEYDSDDLDASESSSELSTIKLDGDSITFDGGGITVGNNTVTITAAGTYSISGTLNNGQIIVDTRDEETVRLVLNGVNITYATGAPISVSNAEKTMITLAAGTENVVTDGSSYIFADAETDEPDAAVFSKDDLTINGDGSLTVNANYNNGIVSKDNLKITGGNIAVNSVNDGIRGGDSIAVLDGIITVDSADDAIHSNGSLTIDGGHLMLTAGDNGVHADDSLIINGGNLTIAQSYEGLESVVITINDGTIHLFSSDDGISVAGGNDGSGTSDPGQDSLNDANNNTLEINGGYIVIDAGGDGIDVNGPGTMNGGVVIVNGPTDNRNGMLDVDGSLVINGGFLVAAGSAGMAQAPGTTSTQYSVLETLPSLQAAGTMIHIESEDGEGILTFVPSKVYQTIVLSSPKLVNGSTYVVYSGGSATGTVSDGLYSDGTYTPGVENSSFTITSMVTG